MIRTSSGDAGYARAYVFTHGMSRLSVQTKTAQNARCKDLGAIKNTPELMFLDMLPI